MKPVAWSVLAGLWLALSTISSVSAAGVSLVPRAKQLTELEGSISIASTQNVAIILGVRATEPEKYAAERLQALVRRRFGLTAEIVSESQALPDAALRVFIGQTDTNGALKRLCEKQKIAIKDISNKPGNDAYALEVLPQEESVAILGSNPRSVIFGMQTLVKLMSYDAGKVNVPAVSIRDWPSIAWRGGDGINLATPDEMDAWVWAGFNFTRAAVPKDRNWDGVKKAIIEAHRRGFFVYAYRTTAVKRVDFDKTVADFQHFIDAGVDGLWLSFDDYGPGESTIPLMERILDLGRRHGMTGRKIAITPPWPDYSSIDTAFDRERSRIPGMADAVWFFTEVPSMSARIKARSVGIKTLPAWWHNWPRPEGGFSHGSYGGRSLRISAKSPYMEVPPLIWGWAHPPYDSLGTAAENTDTVLPCCGRGLPLYFSATLGIWAWEPEHHNFLKTRESIYAAAFGPECVPLMLRYDDIHHLLRTCFTIATNANGLPDHFPPRLRASADKESCRQMVETLTSLANEVTRLAPKESIFTPEHLETEYLEPMRADAAIARASLNLEFPESWWWEHEAEVLQLAAHGEKENAAALAREKASALTEQITKIDLQLGPLLNMKGYVDYWNKRAAAHAAGDLDQIATLFHDQPGGLAKNGDFMKQFQKAEAAPPPNVGTLIAQATPEELSRTIERKGPWMAALYADEGSSGVHFAFPGERDSRARDFCEVSLKAHVAAGSARRFVRFLALVEPFYRPKAGYTRRQGMRSIELICGDKVVWQEDAIDSYEATDQWRTVDVTDALAGGGDVLIKLRVSDDAVFQGYPTVTSPGENDESRGYNRWDPTGYQTFLLIGPMQVFEAASGG